MQTRIPETDHELEQVFAEVSQLRRFAGPPDQFWPRFLAAAGCLVAASRANIVIRHPGEPPRLGKIASWASDDKADRPVAVFNGKLSAIAEETFKTGKYHWSLESENINEAHAVGALLPLPEGQPQCCAVFLLTGVGIQAVKHAQRTLQLIADVPSAYLAVQANQKTHRETLAFAVAMDIVAAVNNETRFVAASLAFCNSLADRLHCERVSVGWLENGFVRVKTISRTEKFNRQMAAAQAIEVALEECVDQNAELIWPAPTDFPLITRDTQKFSEDNKVPNVLSVPLRVDEKVTGAILCERQDGAFSQIEVEQVRLAADLVIRRLADLKRHDRWFGARAMESTRTALAKLVGPEKTWPKVVAAVGAIALVALLLPVWRYRVEGTFVVRSDEVSYLTAPFDGYIKSVEARPGDRLSADAPLLHLNTQELDLEEAGASADYTRYLREAEKSRAAKNFAEMRIAQAQADQAKARLDLVERRIAQSILRTPFEGVVVEGDLRQRISAPVKQGDALMRIARIDGKSLYIEAEIPERDAQEVLGKTDGQIAFVAQPKLKFPIKVTTFEPAATIKDKKNVFLVRCAVVGNPEPWWRPGMTGVAKINIDHRTLLWILTHRTVDFLRLYFWW
jgi:multidrug resistance efflux pump